MFDDIEARKVARNLVKNVGYAVFPCRADKSPATPRGFKDATHDPDAVIALWHRYPGPLLGVASGAPSGVDVLDVDVTSDVGLRWWAAAQRQMNPTRVFRTRSGGLHAYFRHHPGVRNSSGKLARSVDIRGDGGYAIYWFAAGYECIADRPIAAWPAWLLDCVLWKLEPPTSRHAVAAGQPAFTGVLSRIRAAQEGERNSVLFWGACRLRDHGVRISTAVAMLGQVAEETGLAPAEIARTVQSAWRSA